MWGNHLADRSCAFDYTDFGIARDTKFSTYTVDQVLELYTHTDTLYWANLNGEPTLRSFDAVFEENLLVDYESKRDQYRTQRTPPDPPKWSGPMHRSINFATECAELKNRSQGDKARMLRLIWDHFQHGGNCRKGLATCAKVSTRQGTGCQNACTRERSPRAQPRNRQ